MCQLLLVLQTLCLLDLTSIPAMTKIDLLLDQYQIIDQTNNQCDYINNCDYIDLDKTDDEITTNDLNLIQWNIRGLINKQHTLIKETHQEKTNGVVHVYMLNETWVTENNEHLVKIPNYKFVGKHRTTKKGGGVGLAVHNTVQFRLRDDIKLNHVSELEYQFIEIKARKRNIIVGSLYRPPNSKEKEFLKDYKILTEMLKQHKDTDLIMGMDHNMDLLKASKHTNTQDFLDYNIEMNMLPTVNKPTRITDLSATLIDNIFISSRLQDDYRPGIIISDMSDHMPILLRLNGAHQHLITNQTITYRKVTEDNIKALNDYLEQQNWNDELKDLNTEDSFNKLHSIVQVGMNKYIPQKTRRCTKKERTHEPWITKGIKKSIAKQRLLYKTSISKKATDENKRKYKEYRSHLQRIKRHSKREYYQSKCRKYRKETKKLWTIINDITGRHIKKETMIQTLKVGNRITKEANEITQTLSKFFANVGKEYADRIPKSGNSIKNYLNKIPENPLSVFMTPTSSKEVSTVIHGLNNKDSSGFDDISNRILKGITSGISVPLSVLTNRSIVEGIFPTEMKKADTVPLYKGKEKYDKNNYRPISLLLTMSKVIEKIVYKRTYNFLNDSGQLYTSQYGFRSGHSCQDAVAELVGEITRNKDMGLHTIGVFLDLSKAFDTLEHQVLLDKLSKYGIRGTPLEWFRSYLTGRKLRVKCMIESTQKQEYSNYCDVEYGTPQGSCLGPLLFLVFVNDLHRNLEYCHDIQFADDTTIYKGHRSMRYLKWCVETDLKNVSDWFRSNKLTLNASKSVYMIFSRHDQKDLSIKLGDIELPRVSSTKFLGMWVDENLNWNEHLSKLKTKLKRNLTLLKQGKNFLDPTTKKMLYYAQIYSHIGYGLSLWGNMISNTKLQCIQKIQNKAVKLINPYIQNVNKLYLEFGILTTKESIFAENCKITYRLEHDILPGKLPQLFKTDNKGNSLIKNHKYRTRSKCIPNLARMHTKQYTDSFLTKCIVDYQTLPTVTRKSKSKILFNKNLKEIILARKGITTVI